MIFSDNFKAGFSSKNQHHESIFQKTPSKYNLFLKNVIIIYTFKQKEVVEEVELPSLDFFAAPGFNKQHNSIK